MWHVTQEMYETAFSSDASHRIVPCVTRHSRLYKISLSSDVRHIAQSCVTRHSGNVRNIFLDSRVTQNCAACYTPIRNMHGSVCVTSLEKHAMCDTAMCGTSLEKHARECVTRHSRKQHHSSRECHLRTSCPNML